MQSGRKIALRVLSCWLCYKGPASPRGAHQLAGVHAGPRAHPSTLHRKLLETAEQKYCGNLPMVFVESTSIKIYITDELKGKCCSLP